MKTDVRWIFRRTEGDVYRILIRDGLGEVVPVQEPSPFEAQQVGVERLVDAAIRGLHIVAAGRAVRRDRAAAGAPVAPRARAAPLLLIDRQILHANLVGADQRQGIGGGDRGD